MSFQWWSFPSYYSNDIFTSSSFEQDIEIAGDLSLSDNTGGGHNATVSAIVVAFICKRIDLKSSIE